MNFRQPVKEPLPSPFILSEGEINYEYPVHLFLVDPFEGLPPSTQLLYITEFEGKTLVGVPQTAWSRTVSKRAIPATCLTKVSLLEVLACRMSARTTPESEEKMKLWVGYLKPEFMQFVHTFIEDFKCDHFFDDDETDPMLPFAQSLIDAAQEHFAFFSAAEELEVPEAEPEVPEEEELVAASGSPGSLLKRVEKLEGTMVAVSEGVQELLGREKGLVPLTTSAALGKKNAAKKAPTKRAVVVGNPKPKPGTKYPLLDPGVVEAAIQAGVPESKLVEMQRLIGSNAKAAKVKDLTTPRSSSIPCQKKKTVELQQLRLPKVLGWKRNLKIQSTMHCRSSRPSWKSSPSRRRRRPPHPSSTRRWTIWALRAPSHTLFRRERSLLRPGGC